MATHNTDEGASAKELLLEAARRDNTELLTEVLEHHHTPEFLNNSTDALGNTALHVAAQYGAYDVMDELLDQEGLEVDPRNRMEGNTPLHKAVYFAKGEKQLGLEIVKLLTEAGADPRVRNKQKQRPIDISDPRDTELRQVLQSAEYMMSMGNDLVPEEDTDDGPRSGSESS
ncbi:ankyrin repeat-containing domain protein [Tricharina praecox]|uniref:ankyrin repeat-containing domain protein n=1 Tax=Tricharina praecox TaxID=43433 RepID=UPI00221E8672|nr:ankyrin repeat-containing domain protein [Tricharina praecox]KAI5853321.1 ankyrin repeat-containing domain protein [Tricharina praecox]